MEIDNQIDLEKRFLVMLQEILHLHAPKKQVWMYGSRVKGTAKNTSDIDLVIFDSTEQEFYALKDAFDESDIPFLVQIMRWEYIPQDFKENILENYVLVSGANIS